MPDVYAFTLDEVQRGPEGRKHWEGFVPLLREEAWAFPLPKALHKRREHPEICEAKVGDKARLWDSPWPRVLPTTVASWEARQGRPGA